ncbi:hypothetical protein V490_05359 [Pseudogymnoascus sp. VKM F-3557]|nr:hypothetical protein V490_05359 [Pseudogymnoascus sp. VKM F-3557]
MVAQASLNPLDSLGGQRLPTTKPLTEFVQRQYTADSFKHLDTSTTKMLTFKIHHASTNNSLLSGFLAGKLAALRLQALTVSAQAFGGQLVTETFLRMPYTQWIERLQSPHVHTFIAVAYPAGAPEEDQTIDKGEIVGTAVLTSLSGLEVGDDDQETKWHCTALYCSPDFRSKGIGRKLVNARINFAKAASKTKKITIRVMVNMHNTKVLKPLEAFGFIAKGKCTPEESICASRDDILLPSEREGKHADMFTDKRVFVMELYLQVPEKSLELGN